MSERVRLAYLRVWVRWSGRLWLMSLVAAGTLLAVGSAHAEQTSDKERSLSTIPDTSDPVPIAGGQTHPRDFDLAKGEFLQVRVEQQGVDVKLRWYGPDGELKWQVDSPIGRYGWEELVEIAPDAGRYRLEVVVETEDAEPGHYLFHQLDRRSATAEDQRYLIADRAFRTARQQFRDRAYRSTLEKLTEALEIWRDLDTHPREADTLEQLGEAQRRLRDWTAAVSSYEQAVIWNRALARPRRLAATLFNLGSSHLRLGMSDLAHPELAEAASLFREQNNARGLATALLRLGNIDYRQGRFQAALDAFEPALAKSREVGRPSLTASILVSEAWAYLGLSRPQEALEAFMEAYRISLERQDPRSLATVVSGVAQALVQVGDLDNAQRRAKEAVDALVAFDDLRARAVALLHLGNVLERRADFEEAGRAYTSSLKLARQVGDVQCQAVALNGLGHVRAKTGAAQQALEFHDQASALFDQIGDRKGEASGRVRGARALRDLGRFDEAWKRLEPALDAVDDIREETTRQDFRLAYFGFRQEYYEIALDVLMRLHEQHPQAGYETRAIAVNDRRLGRELLDARARRGRELVDPAWIEEEQRLEKRLREVALAADRGDDRDRGTDLVAELHRVRGEIYRAAVAEGQRPDPLDIDRVAGLLLDDDSLLLIYALGDTRSYLWTVSAKARSAHRLPARKEIESRVRAFADEVTRLTERSEASLATLGHELSDLLLAPVAEQLKGRRLIIVSEGELLRLPFGALPEPGSKAWLIEHHEIVHLPSISTLVSLRQQSAKRSTPQRTVALFADPVFQPEDPRLGAVTEPSETAGDSSDSRTTEGWRGDLLRAAEQLGVDPYRRLPGSRAEAEAILKLAAGGRPFLASGLNANRETFFGVPLTEFGVLHLATHALVHPRPELSGLILSLVDERGHPRDGFLRTFEIARLDLPVDLVVLSACETGLGPEIRGEGPLGLAWGFLQAGATRVIASLWRVSDAATAELMTSFYTAILKRGIPPAAALREAQLTLLRQPNARPRDWAGFIFQGDWQALRPYPSESTAGDFTGET